MKAKQKSPSPIAWALGQTGEHNGQYVISVFLAIVGVAFSVAQYFVVVCIVQGLMEGNKDLSFYLIRCLIIAALWLGRVLFHDTIANNIRFGQPDAPMEDVIAAAKKACCHECPIDFYALLRISA